MAVWVAAKASVEMRPVGADDEHELGCIAPGVDP
jgi:hypothetical protein